MSDDGRSIPRRIGDGLLRLLALFVILEPIWMLLPFAGFLYGSVLRIETLSRNPATAWLTHFVFPVLAIGWGGPALAVLGLLVFVVGAGQIYVAKIRRSGLVTTGLYRFVRHPQYVALTLFGLGILLTWGRAIAYLGFFLMMWLYAWLARHEEARCARLFGGAWIRYRERTSFVLPGDRRLRGLGRGLGIARWPTPVRFVASFALAAVLAFGSMALIDRVKRAARTVPYLAATVSFAGTPGPPAVDLEADETAGVPFVRRGRLTVVRGPWRSAAAPGFAERVALRLPDSAALADFLAFLREPGTDEAIVFALPLDARRTDGEMPDRGGPGSGDGRGPPPDPAGPDRVRLIILRASADPLRAEERVAYGGARIVPIDLDRPPPGDIVVGAVFTPGPLFPAAERLEGLADRTREVWAESHVPAGRAVPPGTAREATLVLVKAPILRTRIDPGFAETLRDRLLASARFRDRLEKTGAGGAVVPVAFPRPGPNWYREHHGEAQISVFVVLARKRDPAAPTGALFEPGERDLLGAFTAELDLGVAPPADPVGRIEAIGPGRDLEERVAFFLSGL